MKNFRVLMIAMMMVMAVGIGNASAATYHFTGNIDYNTDVIYVYFTLTSDATDVKIWTDSFNSGANFDPITALWTASGTLIAENDDNATISPSTQTYWDSGIVLSYLAAGDYIFTIATYANWAAGTTLSDGFVYDGTESVAITSWRNEGTGYWSLWLEGVDSASTVPEPASMLLLGLSLIGLAGFRKRMH